MILVGGLLAATTGVVAATVIAMGLISLPVMLRYGYDKRLASGVIAASGTLAQIVPPSLVLIALADQLGASVGDPYKGALLLALARGRLSRLQLTQAMDSTTRLTAFVIFILIGSTIFTLVFRGLDGDVWVEHLFDQLPGGVLGFLIAVNMQTAFMHPPFGFALFYLKSVAPKAIRTADIYRGAIPFLAIQLVMVAVVLAFPQVVLRDAPADASSVTEIPIEVDPDAYYLPAEWR